MYDHTSLYYLAHGEWKFNCVITGGVEDAKDCLRAWYMAGNRRWGEDWRLIDNDEDVLFTLSKNADMLAWKLKQT